MSDGMPLPAHAFVVSREVDATGVSGTGIVAQGVVFADGTVALRWLTEYRSTAIYTSIDVVRAIHGHNGSTHIVWQEADGWVPDDQAVDVDRRYAPISIGEQVTTPHGSATYCRDVRIRASDAPMTEVLCEAHHRAELYRPDEVQRR